MSCAHLYREHITPLLHAASLLPIISKLIRLGKNYDNLIKTEYEVVKSTVIFCGSGLKVYGIFSRTSVPDI